MNDQTQIANNTRKQTNGAPDASHRPAQSGPNAETPANERTAGERPIRTVSDGAISAKVWERQNEDGEGPNYSTKIVRTWRDEKGQFHESNNYSEFDLKRLANVAQNTSDVIAGLRQSHDPSQSQVPQNSQEVSNPAPENTQNRDQYIEERQGQAPKQSLENTRVRNDW